MVARFTGVVLLLVWASSPPTAPPLRQVLVAFKVSHLSRLATLPLLLSGTGQDQTNVVAKPIQDRSTVTVLFRQACVKFCCVS